MSKQQADANRIEDFEKALGELETLVEKLEKGDLSLEDSLKQFERGVKLARGCQTALRDAELTVRKLIEENGQASLQDLDDAGDTGDAAE